MFRRMVSAAILLVLTAMVATLGLLLSRIAWLESRELDRRGEVIELAGLEGGRGTVAVSAALEQGEDAVFELCAGDDMGEAWGDAIRAEIRANDEIAVETVLDAATRARARTSSSGACLELGRGTLELSGEYRIVLAARAAPPPARARARILARRPLGPTERNAALGLLALAMSLVVVLAARPRATSLSRSRAPRWVRVLRVRARRLARRRDLGRAIAMVALGTVLVVMAGIATPFVLPGGSTYGLVAGLALALVEVFLAWALLGGTMRPLLLVRPEASWRTAVFFASAPIVGFVLSGFAIWSLSHVEATGEAPIEAFVSWPSGLLSFAALAVVAPVAEEVFFRGFVFGAIDDGRWSGRRALAFLLAWGLFALAHLQQAWGNWGGLLAVTVAGLVFTMLRALSGSTLVPALAHLVYNALLSLSALGAAGALLGAG